MLSILAVAAAAVAFPGGSPSELAKSIAESTKANVVIEAGPSEILKSFTFEPSSLDEMARAILKATGLKQAPGEDYVYSHPDLPIWHFDNPSIQRLLDDPSRVCQAGSLPENSLKDGNVTVHSNPRSAVLVTSLQGMKFSKLLEVDRFFINLGLNAWVTDMPERDFLNFVCKAVGGRLKTTKVGLSLEPTGQEIQRRALATFERVKKESGHAKLSSIEKAELELNRTAVAAASPAMLEQLIASDGKPIRMEIGPVSRGVVMQMIRALMEQSSGQDSQGFVPPVPPPADSVENRPENRFRNLDRRLIGTLVLNRGFRAWAELVTVDQLGRPGPVMRVP